MQGQVSETLACELQDSPMVAITNTESSLCGTYLYILRTANETAHSGHHNTSTKPVLKLACFRLTTKCHILSRSLLLGMTTSNTPSNRLRGTRLTASLASLHPSPAQTARRVHIVLHIPARYRHLYTPPSSKPAQTSRN